MLALTMLAKHSSLKFTKQENGYQLESGERQKLDPLQLAPV
jgi:hypothetical protein